MLAGIWSELLGVSGGERVGATDNFFDLGGHSLLATRVISRLRSAFGVEMPLRDLFTAPRLADLAARVEALRQTVMLAAPPLLRAPHDGPMPLSFAQQRLWFIDQLEPGSPLYNIPIALRVEGPLDRAVLAHCLGEVLRRHEALRTVFGEREGAPVQVIQPAAPFLLPVVDLSGLPETERESLVPGLVGDESGRPFDLSRDLLLRGVLLRLGPSDHVAALTMHHIASDGWSLGILVREVTGLYAGTLLPELPVQYADFAAWQRSWLAGETLEQEIAFWRRQLAGLPPVLALPLDRPRPAVQSFRGGSRPVWIPTGLTRSLEALARREGATLFMVLLAGFQSLLSRLSGQDDFAVGTPVAGRNRVETEGLIGFFVNTLVLRGNVTGKPTFRELLGRVRETALAAYMHQDVPFERLVEDLAPERSLAHTPLFQVMFALQNFPYERVHLPGLSITSSLRESATAKFELGLTFMEAGGELGARLDFAADLFDAATILRLASHLPALLAAGTADPGRSLQDLPLLSDGERHQLRAEWNDTSVPAAPGVIELFAAQALRSPEAVAVTDAGGSLTYRALDRRSNFLAQRLRALGAGPGVPVGLCVERTADLVVAALAILKSGGAWLSLDPSHPRGRLAFLLEDAAVPLLVVQQHLLPILPPYVGKTILMDETGEESEVPLGLPAADSLAYLIYTSGTTGRPKAVMVEHGMLAATLAATRALFGFVAGDRMPCLALSTFDIFLFELFSPLLSGGTAVLFPLRPALDVEGLVDRLGEMTCLHAVPALMRQVVDAVRRRSVDVEKLRAVFVGGDAVPAELLEDLRETFPAAQVWVLYGPTEGTILCTAHLVPPVPEPALPLLGRPLPGAVVDVRDAHDADAELLPIGVPGELWIGGRGVTRGYLGRAELTAEKYVVRGGERFYRSGDRVRRLADGTLEFLGRLDQQVKLRGFRIELGEVESSLGRHAEVREAVALVQNDPSGQRLVAYVVRETEGFAPEAATAATDHVTAWQALYEETYGQTQADATFNLEGWNSSYTGEPIPAEEMREWVERTVERVLALGGRRILEVGCGTGLLLFRVAPGAEIYQGTDFSSVALEGIHRQIERMGGLPGVSLACRTADDWSGVAPGDFDTVVLNSVAQYFPGIDYLTRAVEGAVASVAPGGRIFLGDLRSLPLLEALQTSVEVYRSAGDLPVEELRRRILRRLATEEELLIDPGFFFTLARRLPEIRQVEILVKRGRYHNELSRFRYDAVLHVGAPQEPENDLDWLDWQGQGLSLSGLAERLGAPRRWTLTPDPSPNAPPPAGRGAPAPVPAARTPVRFPLLPADGGAMGVGGQGGEVPAVLAVTAIPNRRLASEAAAAPILAGLDQDAGTVGELRQMIVDRAEAADSIDPEELWQLGERLGYSVGLTWDPKDPYRFSAVLRRGAHPAPIPSPPGLRTGLPAHAYANDPLRHKVARRLVPELRRFLQGELPEYMVPSAVVLLDRLPLTAHGKVDRAALPSFRSLEALRPEPVGAPVVLSTEVEEILAAIWSDLLGLERVGAADNFFDLGGHSLLATQVMSRLRSAFGVELPVRVLFEAPRLADLAARVEAARQTGTAAPASPLVRVSRENPLPLSFSQQRLWFLDQLEPGSPLYNIPVLLRIEGALSVPVLARCLSEIVRRHEALRTVFTVEESTPVQVIQPAALFALPVVDLSGLPEAARESLASVLAREEAARPFDLARGPLLRGVLLRLAFPLSRAAGAGWERGPGGEGLNDHVVALAMHHIASDGWSMGILAREVAALYTAYAADQPSPLPELAVQYADFAVWQRQRLQGETLAEQLGWWRERLAGAPPFLALPADRPRPAVQRYRGQSQLQQVPLSGAAELGRETGATPFMILLAAFAALLSRWSGQLDLVVGSPIAGRTRAETEPLIGLFLNTLALRTDLSGDPPFRELVGQVREVTLGAYAHQDLPFEKLVEELSPERDLSHSPIFQVLFVLQNAPLEALELPGLRLRPVGSGSATAKFDLVLNATEAGGELSCQWRYNSDLFDSTRIARLRDHFAALLAAALADPGTDLSALPLLSAAERHQTLCEWNDSQVSDPMPAISGVCFPDLFAAQAERTPGAVAAVCGEESLTYRELQRRARRWAAVLVGQGVGPESVVPILSPRGLPFLTAVLAVLEAGGAYLPLDPQQPAARALGVVRQSGSRLLLSGGGLGPQLLAAEPDAPPFLQVLELEDLERLDGDAAPQPARSSLDHLAYVIYTSGSTGLPKGAMIPHRGLSNHTLITLDVLGLTGADTVAQNSAQSSDISVWQMLSALAVGGRVAIYPDAVAHDPAALLAAVAHDGVTVLELVPSLLTAMLEMIEGDAGHDLSHLRWLIPTGEALPPELCRRWLARFPGIPLLNAYGPTECSDDVSFGPIRDVPADAAWRPAIGRPVANMQLYVVDRDLQPQPLGVPGELCIGGLGVGRGYFGDPARTALAFVPAAGARLYRTGDLARWRADGALEFLGRIDHQVKVRGFRIELGEIEVVLAEHSAVQEAVVDLRGQGTAQRLVAWVTADTAEPDLLASLRSHLQDRLPGYMIPAAFVLLAAFPRTANGKVDRRALPDPETAAAAGAEHAAPRTSLEEYLAGLWRQALAIDSVGIHDSFFDLGGNSITGAILMNRLQREMGGVIHVVVLFDAPTVAKMAAYLEREKRKAVDRIDRPDRPDRPDRIDRARLAAFRAVIPPLPPSTDLAVEKNPPAIFILSPPRAGSTLLRVMLGGHPRLFSPPELELLSFNTMAEREAAFPGRDSFWLEGLLRAVMEVRHCDVAAAREIVAAAIENGWTTQRFYRQLQEQLDGRTLVDKTTTYALDLNVLRRAEEAFEKPFYIHLLRHPYASVRSFDEVKLDELFFRHPHSFERAELAELIWQASHENILHHLAEVPAERQIRIRFEDLVRQPEAELRRLCDALGIDLDPAMVNPYQEGPARMTDGIHAEGKMLGDVKFLQYKGVEAGIAERSREARPEFLGEPTWEMAALLGYERPPLAPPTIIPRAGGVGEPRPLSFAQQRLWFIDQLEPGSALYNLPVALRVEGPLDPRVLAATLSEIVRRHEALRTVFAAPEGSPVQVVQPAASFALPVVDLSAVPAAEREPLAVSLAIAEAGRPFDLSWSPMLRGMLLHLAPHDHVAVLTMHHIASDGWSMGILVREVSALYAAIASGRPSPLPELPVQYSDFAVWQRSWLAGEILEGEIDVWRRRLAGLPPVLELPTDRPRPAVQSFRGANRPVWLPAGLTRQVEGLARREGATLFMALLAGFQALLARTSRQDDLAVGSPISGRNRMEIEGLIGFFVNTLVLRGDLSDVSGNETGAATFRELLGRTRETVLAAFLHQDVPFEKLVEELAPERSLAHTPLFQVMFVLQNAPSEGVAISDLHLRRVSVTGTLSKFDLTLTLSEHGGELAGHFEYATDLFDAATMERLALHFGRLFAAAVGAPDAPFSELPLLSPEERGQILIEWNDTNCPAAPRSVYELFAAQVRRTPQAVAVVFGSEELTYAGLDARAGRVARRLRRLGVGPDVLVGLLVERSLDMIAGVLGILQAGGVYVPLDPQYPAERLAFMLDDTRAPVLLTQESLRDRLPAGSARVLLVDGDDEGGSADWSEGSEPAAENLGYVIYTSGSTGRPKGVALSQGTLRNLIDWHLATLLGGARTLQYASLSFDASFHEMFACWGSGGTLVVVPEELRRDLGALAGLLVEQRIEKAILPVVVLQQLAEIFAGREDLPPLREITTTGERLQTNREMAALLRRLPGCAFHNHYGPSETHVATAFTLSPDPEEWTVYPPVGRPIGNSTAYIFEPGLVPAPIGVPGDLYLGGVCLARGYLGRPDLTASRFVPHPCSAEPGARLYRTGDKVRFLANGDLEFIGRFDDQVKIRGFRIEPGEIEAMLMTLEGVREAVVVVQSDGSVRTIRSSGDRRLVAYLVGDAAPDVLRRSLREKLPEYMVPGAFVVLPTLPLTPNGKVDRKALPAPERQSAAESFVAPRTPVEELVAGIWAELLGVSRESGGAKVGRNSNFFDLGGHSLLAVRVMARIEHVLGVKVPISALFEAPTVEHLAALIQGRKVPRTAPLVRLHPGGAERPLFLAPPVGGNVFSYVALAKKLGAKRPVYGLQALDEGIGAPPSMVDLAAHYLATVRKVQPEGPWLLGAWSAGAVTAFEMGRQIESAGGTALVTMFDPPPPPDGIIRAVDDTGLLLAFSRLAHPSAERKALIRELVEGLDVEAGLVRLLELARAGGMLSADVGMPWMRERFNLYCRTMTTVEGYLPRPFGGRVILFRADTMMAPGAVDLIWGWDRLARTEAHLIVNADHASLLQEPALDQLVEILESALADAEEVEGDPGAPIPEASRSAPAP